MICERRIAGIVRICALGIFACTPALPAQTPDSAAVTTENMVEALQRLQQKVRSLEQEIAQLKYWQTDSTLAQLLNAAETDDEDESIPEIYRSRRRRLDAVLKAFAQRPGVIYLNGSGFSSFQARFGEGERLRDVVGVLDLFVHARPGKNALFFINLHSIGGNGPDTALQPLASLNAAAGSTQARNGLDGLNVLEAWLEWQRFDDKLTLTAGKIDLTNYFDNNVVANDEYSQFYSGAFVNSASFPAPANAPGLRAVAGLTGFAKLQFGIVNSRNAGNRIFSGTFAVAGLAFRRFADTDFEANLRVYGYRTSEFGGGYGLGASYDQFTGRRWAWFLRLGTNERELGETYGVRSAWSFGGRYFLRRGRRAQTIGMAFGQSAAGPGLTRRESLLEAYFRQQINRWTFISPHVQLLFPAATGEPASILPGMRMQLTF